MRSSVPGGPARSRPVLGSVAEGLVGSEFSSSTSHPQCKRGRFPRPARAGRRYTCMWNSVQNKKQTERWKTKAMPPARAEAFRIGPQSWREAGLPELEFVRPDPRSEFPKLLKRPGALGSFTHRRDVSSTTRCGGAGDAEPRGHRLAGERGSRPGVGPSPSCHVFSRASLPCP